MPDQPLVSIIIPTFNRAHLIGETLDSVLAQTYTNWECIVVDDGSTDGTSELMEAYCAKDSRFQYHHRPKDRLPGGNAARNYGFELSLGEYVMFIDSDDLLRANCLANRVSNLNNSLNIDFLVFQSQIFQETVDDSTLIPNVLFKKTEDLMRFISFDYPWNISATLIKKDFLVSNKISWNESLRIHQDLEFYIRILLKSPKYEKIETIPDVFVRMGTDDKISNRKFDKQMLLSKYRFQNTVLSLLKNAGYDNRDYILRLYGLSLVNSKLFFKANYFSLIFKTIKSFFRSGNLKYGLLLFPDVLYLFFIEKIKYHTLREILKKYEILFVGNRFEFLPPRGSTLGKTKLIDYLNSLN